MDALFVKITHAWSCSWLGSTELQMKALKETISKVEQWAKDHPVKTRQSEFLKIFQKATIRDGVLTICPMAIDKALDDPERCHETTCHKCLEKYWLAEVTDNE